MIRIIVTFPVINLIVGSGNMINLKKYEFLKKQINGDSSFHQIPTICQRFLLFLNGPEFWKVEWINRKRYVMHNYVLIIFL